MVRRTGAIGARAFVRRAVTAVCLAAALAACGGGGTTGGAPTPVDDESGQPTTTPTETPSSTPTSTPTTTTSSPVSRQIIVVTHRFQNIPAAKAFAAQYPLYFKALVDKDTDLLRTRFPAYFYADTEAQITLAKDAGWVMRPPASIVLRNVETLPDGKVRISSCRSQRTEYWNPATKAWTRSAPKGSPDVIIMARRGSTWVMYRWLSPPPVAVSCGGIPYPA